MKLENKIKILKIQFPTLKNSKIILVLLCIILSINFSKADLPVHCLSSSIEGLWTINMGDNIGNKDIGCGHSKPDYNLDHINTDNNKLTVHNKIQVYLERPNIVYDEFKNNVIGRWTMVYDEGFELNINDNLFFAFSRYNKINKVQASNKDNSDTVGYQNLCGETFLGWFHNQITNKNWGCFYASKNDKTNTTSKSGTDMSNSLHNVVQHSENNYNNNENLQHKNKVKTTTNILDDNYEGPIPDKFLSNMNNLESDMDNENNNRDTYFMELSSDLNMSIFQPDKNFVNRINSDKNSLWTAKIHEEFVGKTLNYMNKLRGMNAYHRLKNLVSSSPDENSAMFLETEISSNLILGSSNKDSTRNRNRGQGRNRNSVKNRFRNTLNSKSKNRNRQNQNYSDMDYDTLADNLDGMLYEGGENEYKLDKINNRAKKLNEMSFRAKDNVSSEIFSNQNNHNNNINNNIKYPKHFDWRNINGINYDSPVRKQGECGSCYAIASISVLESRIRIKTNNQQKPILSVGSAISCSRYNQGCEGGYPYLIGKHGREHGIVEEKCQRYTEDDSTCNKECFNAKTYKVADYGYVGDYYGGTNEYEMTKEIYNNGPIVVALNAASDLYYYSGGIFTSGPVRAEGSFEKKIRPWEYTNHAVVCVGWGEEVVNGNVEKYWILKNSWGRNWGDNGYFKIKKGIASVDAQAIYLTPEI